MTRKDCSIELELPIAISENKYRRHVPGCSHPIICSAGRKFHDLVKFRFMESGQRKIAGPVAVNLEFYPPDRRKRDLDNQFKCLFDSIVNAGCIEDDSEIYELHAYKREPIQGGLNYLRITGTIPAVAAVSAVSIRELLHSGRLAEAIGKYGMDTVADYLSKVTIEE